DSPAPGLLLPRGGWPPAGGGPAARVLARPAREAGGSTTDPQCPGRAGRGGDGGGQSPARRPSAEPGRGPGSRGEAAAMAYSRRRAESAPGRGGPAGAGTSGPAQRGCLIAPSGPGRNVLCSGPVLTL